MFYLFSSVYTAGASNMENVVTERNAIWLYDVTDLGYAAQSVQELC